MKNKGAINIGMLAVLLVVIGVGAGLYTGTISLPQGTYINANTTCRDVYCADYGSLCCSQVDVTTDSSTLTPKTYTLSVSSEYKCDYYTCVIQTQPSGFVTGFKASAGSSCSNNAFFGFGTVFSCSGATAVTSYPVTLGNGDHFYTSGTAQVSVLESKLVLKNNLGITIKSDSCVYQTDKSIYDNNGNLLVQPKEGIQASYTVPNGQCIQTYSGRHVCADTCEYCDIDTDCKALYPFVYNGYGATCGNNIVTTYGCRNYGTVPPAGSYSTDILGKITEITSKPISASWNSDFGKRCEIVSSIQVSCCPGTTCGSGGTCDPTTFTCVQPNQVQCSADWQCGTTEICDYTKDIIIKDACVLGSCSKKTVSRQMDCCYDSDCATTEYCDSDGTCKERSDVRQQCPFGCCEGNPNYFDKSCGSSEVCCGSGECASNVEQCTIKPKGVDYIKLIIGGLLAGLILTILLFVSAMFIKPIKNVLGKMYSLKGFILITLGLSLLIALSLSGIAYTLAGTIL